MTRALYWMRNDLRLTENQLFENAIQNSTSILCVYVHDPRQWENTIASIPRMGWHRRRFLHETLLELDTQLKNCGLRLVELWGHPEDVLPELVEDLKIEIVYHSKECAPEERTSENILSARLGLLGVEIVSDWTSFLLHPDSLPFVPHETPDVFSDFRKQVEKCGLASIVSSHREKIPTTAAPAILSQTPRMLTDLSFILADRLTHLNGPSTHWAAILPCETELLEGAGKKQGPFDKMNIMRGGATAGKGRVENYIFQTRAIASYFDTRNGLLEKNDSTLFSPWLANGSLSPVFVFNKVKEYESRFEANKSTEWVVFELLWRDFFRLMVLKHGVKIFLPSGIREKREAGRFDKQTVQDNMKKILTASTPHPFINANMRELIQTGFMSNRGRQNVASHMIHELKIPWTWGAWCFESLLVDYDPASNWGNWAYLAGVGNDPRGVRVFDIDKQQAMYDAEGNYLSAWG
jgi:deoxyribodipyrimidine photo-lyase